MATRPDRRYPTAGLGVLAGICLFAFACQTPPPPSGFHRESPSLFYHVPERGFAVNVSEPSVRYQLVLERIDEPPRVPLRLTIHYANPAQPDEPFREEAVFHADQTFLFLESPPVEGLREGVFYEIAISTQAKDEEAEPLENWALIIESPLEMRLSDP